MSLTSVIIKLFKKKENTFVAKENKVDSPEESKFRLKVQADIKKGLTREQLEKKYLRKK